MQILAGHISADLAEDELVTSVGSQVCKFAADHCTPAQMRSANLGVVIAVLTFDFYLLFLTLSLNA